jgi:hypothetical protein
MAPMSKTIRKRVFGSGEQAQLSFRGVLGSVGLHLLLAAALILLYSRYEPSPVTSPGILVVDMVLFGDGNDDGGLIPEAEAIAEQPEPAPGQSEQSGAEIAAVDPALERDLPDESASAETFSAVEAPRLEELAEAPFDDDELTSSIATLPIEPTPLQSDPDLLAMAAAPLPDFTLFREPETAPIEATERQMLDDRLVEWSVDSDSVTDEHVVFNHDGRNYSAEFKRVAAEDSMGIDNVLVSISTERDGRRWSTNMRMQRLAFSSFAQFVDRWDPSIMLHDDEIDGRFHANSDIFLSSSRRAQPAFLGKVTTARRINTSNSESFVRRDQVFLGGLETRVQRINLPQQFVALDTIDDVPPDRVHRFTVDTDLIFFADGSFSWTDLEDGSPEQRVLLTDEPHYLLGDEDVSFRISGVVNGKVLVHSREDIVLVGDLVYAEHPVVTPASDDFVGLVAGRNVVIAERRISGSGDLTVHAAVFAKRHFLVRNYRSGGLDTLHVFGSLAVGSLSATEPRFRTRLEFDPRLKETRPPGFPVTDRYEVIEWDGLWVEEMPTELLSHDSG